MEKHLAAVVAKWRMTADAWERQDRDERRAAEQAPAPPHRAPTLVAGWIAWLRACAQEVEDAVGADQVEMAPMSIDATNPHAITAFSLGRSDGCALCGVQQPCPRHGRTPIHAKDYAELHVLVADELGKSDEAQDGGVARSGTAEQTKSLQRNDGIISDVE